MIDEGKKHRSRDTSRQPVFVHLSGRDGMMLVWSSHPRLLLCLRSAAVDVGYLCRCNSTKSLFQSLLSCSSTRYIVYWPLRCHRDAPAGYCTWSCFTVRVKCLPRARLIKSWPACRNLLLSVLPSKRCLLVVVIRGLFLVLLFPNGVHVQDN